MIITKKKNLMPTGYKGNSQKRATYRNPLKKLLRSHAKETLNWQPSPMTLTMDEAAVPVYTYGNYAGTAKLEPIEEDVQTRSF